MTIKYPDLFGALARDLMTKYAVYDYSYTVSHNSEDNFVELKMGMEGYMQLITDLMSIQGIPQRPDLPSVHLSEAPIKCSFDEVMKFNTSPVESP